jgi:hypothetical protein
LIKVVYGVAALIAVLVIGVFVAPIDRLDDLKPTIAERASAAWPQARHRRGRRAVPAGAADFGSRCPAGISPAPPELT